jgi:hypothetical protein
MSSIETKKCFKPLAVSKVNIAPDYHNTQNDDNFVIPGLHGIKAIPYSDK